MRVAAGTSDGVISLLQSFSITIHLTPGAERLTPVDSIKPFECPLSSANGRPQQD